MFILCLSVLCVLLLSCSKKDDGIVISGTIIDSNQGVDIGGVSVEIWAQKIESGIFSAHYDNYGTQITDEKGRFSFNLENQTYASIKLTFSQTYYYYWESFIDGREVNNKYLHDETYEMQPKAWIEFVVKNINPIDLEDYFEFRIMNGTTECEFCCENDLIIFSGMEVEQEWLCQMVGHTNINISWNSRKGGTQKGDKKIIFLPAFDTTRVELLY